MVEISVGEEVIRLENRPELLRCDLHQGMDLDSGLDRFAVFVQDRPPG